MEILGKAFYDLNELKRLLNNPTTRIITGVALREAASLGYSSTVDMVHQVMRLRTSDVYKTMESEKCPGLWQDVYRINDGNNDLYIKIQKTFDGKGVIIAFKER